MRVYLDSNIIQHSATFRRSQSTYYGQRSCADDLISYGPVEVAVKDARPGTVLGEEIQSLPFLAAQLRRIGATLIMDQHAGNEIKRAGSFPEDYFYSSRIFYAVPPVDDGLSIISGGMCDLLGVPRNSFHRLLTKLTAPRFLELAAACGAPAGTRKYNQLADAYFLWCAEKNACDYFLSLDFELQRLLRNSRLSHPAVPVVRARELIDLVLKI